MSRGAEVTLACWDGEHTFRLRIGELRQLQEKCDAGPAVIAARLRDGTWKVDDIRETLRLGLIGAGVDQERARSLVVAHVDGVPLGQNVVHAYGVVLAAIVGVEDERPGEARAGEATDPDRSPAASSGSPASTEREP